MRPHLAFVDSGSGGLPYLARTRELLPDAVYSYVADPRNFPYGEKPPEELIGILVSNTKKIINILDPDVIVVACNTASVVGLKALRETFDLPFVGVVPAVKPAAVLSKNKRFGILATRETVGNPYTQELIDAYALDSEVFRYAGIDIIRFIEERFFDVSDAQKREILGESVRYFRENSVDAVVLGCTHYLHLKNELAELLGGGVMIVDSVEGVARQTVKIAGGLARSGGETDSESALYLAGPAPSSHSLIDFSALFGLEYKGVLS